MREIKFRAWDKKQSWITEVVCLNMGTWIDIVLKDPRKHVAMDYTYNQTTKNVVLMQYTGLKDKNGKEIYDGDIIKRTLDSGSETINIVMWNNSYACFIRQSITEKEILGGNWDFLDGRTIGSNIGFEIIGNIYENPELLGEEKDECKGVVFKKSPNEIFSKQIEDAKSFKQTDEDVHALLDEVANPKKHCPECDGTGEKT